ncbi:hypothetical protein NL676_018925 [Syzygium grande]|nr:hypothetical protein NL676_018925 [Syzygium grande]
MSTKSDLVFIPWPGLGHLVSTVEISKLLVDRKDRLSVTILVVKLPIDSEADSRVESFAATVAAGIRFVILPRQSPLPGYVPSGLPQSLHREPQS